ncbi:MAG TPA: hypothetical protein PLR28_09655 [Dokdonella sp.]|nr:hypothetical protein [Dokdonella sp.]
MSSYQLNAEAVRSRAQRCVDRSATSPITLAPDDPVRILHDAPQINLCSEVETEEARNEVSDLEDKVERLTSIIERCALALHIDAESDSDEFVQAIDSLQAAVPDEELPDVLSAARDSLTQLLDALAAKGGAAQPGTSGATEPAKSEQAAQGGDA